MKINTLTITLITLLNVNTTTVQNVQKLTETTVITNTGDNYTDRVQRIYATDNLKIQAKSYYEHNYHWNRTPELYTVTEWRLDVVKISVLTDEEGQTQIFNDIQIPTGQTYDELYYYMYTTSLEGGTESIRNTCDTFLAKTISTANLADLRSTAQTIGTYTRNNTFEDYTEVINPISYAEYDENHRNYSIYMLQLVSIQSNNQPSALNNNNLNLVSQCYEITTDLEVPPPTPTVINYEVLDIPGIMFTILGMPFAWLSTAFNLTLFPNTLYSLNISTLLFTVLGSLIIIWIIKRFIK